MRTRSAFLEAGFRYFLPAYLISDLRGRLQTADPLFHLTHGFSDWTTEVPAGDRTLVIRHGRSAFINPRRYGAMTSYDYARWRLSVFTREEANAIVAYLEFKRDLDPNVIDRTAIDAALKSFWLERARTAPQARSLEQHIAEQQAYLAAFARTSKRVLEHREPKPHSLPLSRSVIFRHYTTRHSRASGNPPQQALRTSDQK